MKQTSPTPSVSELISQITYTQKEKLWFESMAENLPLIRAEGDVKELYGTMKGKKALVVGAGPSVGDWSGLRVVANKNIVVVACDKALVPLLNNNVIPTIVCTLDGDPTIKDFYPAGIRNSSTESMRTLVSVHAHPEAVRRIWNRYWFCPLVDDALDGKIKSVSRVMHWMAGKTLIQPLGNVGGLSALFALELGCSPIILYGLDFSYGEELSPMRTLYWEGFKARVGDTSDTIKHCYRYINTGFGKRVLTDLVMFGYWQALERGLQATGAKVINCSPYSIVDGSNIQHMALPEAIDK